MRGAGAGFVAVGALVVLTGCGAASEDDVRAVATAFTDPSASGQERCELLAPATLGVLESDASAPCADVIGEVPLPGGEVSSVEVWSGDAQVRVGSDVLFLTETGEGWRVTAAACRPRGELPYDCEVEGP